MSKYDLVPWGSDALNAAIAGYVSTRQASDRRYDQREADERQRRRAWLARQPAIEAARTDAVRAAAKAARRRTR